MICLLLVACSDSPFTDEIGVWTDITPDSDAILNSLYFLDAEQGWAAGTSRCQTSDPCEGTRAAIFTTRDGGTTWDRILVEEGINFNGIHFFDRQQGVAASFNVFKSGDGGHTWSEVVKLRGPIIRDMEFPESSVGWAAANDEGAVVMRSRDRGQSWQKQEGSHRGGTQDYYTSISAPIPNTAYATGYFLGVAALLIRTRDGGTTWEEVATPADSDVSDVTYYTVEFVDSTYGWIAGSFRTVFRTTDGGQTWERQDMGEGSTSIRGFHALSRDRALAVTSDGTIFVTSDGGATWQEQFEADAAMGRVFYTASGVAYASGNRRLLRARLFD